MSWTPPERNYDGVKHEKIRRYVDELATHVHDEVSKAYYNNEPFVLAGHDFGILSEEQFNTFHAVSNDIAILVRHRANKYLSNTEGFELIPEEEYRYHHRTDESGAVIETIDRVAESQTRLQNVLRNVPRSVATHEFTVRDPRDGSELPITLNHLATFDLTI